MRSLDMDCVSVSIEPSMKRRLMMSLAGTPRASANSETVMPSGIFTTSRSAGFWSFARASATASW